MKMLCIIVSIIIVTYYGLLFLGALFFEIYKEIKNKKFDENANINYIQFVTGFTHLITDKTIRKEYKHVGDGIACIATGLNYFPISFEDIVTEVRDRTFKDKEYAYISIESIQKYNKQHPNSVISYDFASGDRIRFC